MITSAAVMSPQCAISRIEIISFFLEFLALPLCRWLVGEKKKKKKKMKMMMMTKKKMKMKEG